MRNAGGRGRWLVFAAALCAAWAARGQAQEPVIRREVNLVLVDATVRDRAGRPMKELKQEDFLIYADNEQQEIAHFSRDQIPLAVALVVDLSGSIQPFLRPLRYASISALRTLKAEDEVALFTFSSEPQLRVELTRDKPEVSTEIEMFSAGGATNINDAVYDAAHYLWLERPAARRVIVLISDNVATGEHRYSPGEVTEEALRADAAVYGVRVPGYNPLGARLTQKLTRGHVNVKQLAAETGGEVFDVEEQGSVFLALQAVVERLKTRYTLGFYPPGAQRGTGKHALDVRLHPSFGSKGADYTIIAKRAYYAWETRGK